MSKYQALADRLAASPGDEWLTSFAELEEVLGFPLPKAARSGRKWWANALDKAHSRAWAAHGWEVGDVDHAAERVVFRRGAASAQALQAAAGLEPLAKAIEPSGGSAASEVQPEVMRQASEAASRQARLGGGWRATGLAAAGLAMIAGLGALAARGLMRRR